MVLKRAGIMLLMWGALGGTGFGQASNALDKQAKAEAPATQSRFLISWDEPTYFLPFYYTTSPDRILQNYRADSQQASGHTEVKFQLSFKIDLWQKMFGQPIDLYAAYTQLSFWQLYQSSSFFRETDYAPEIFFADHVEKKLFSKWKLNFLRLGAVHQSNGYGGQLERTWNRIYLSFLFSNTNWILIVKPWYVLHDASYEKDNPHMAHYLGYESMTLAYQIHHHTFSLAAQNTLESGFARTGMTASWSFPLTTQISGYIQVFNGYGQSLIEYSHRTTSFGVGISLHDWM